MTRKIRPPDAWGRETKLDEEVAKNQRNTDYTHPRHIGCASEPD